MWGLHLAQALSFLGGALVRPTPPPTTPSMLTGPAFRYLSPLLSSSRALVVICASDHPRPVNFTPLGCNRGSRDLASSIGAAAISRGGSIPSALAAGLPPSRHRWLRHLWRPFPGSFLACALTLGK